MISIKNKKVQSVLLLAVILLNNCGMVFAQTITDSTSVSTELRLIPTSIVITPSSTTVREGSADVQFTATAYYNYPGLTTPIPPKNITNDLLSTWSSTNSSVGLISPSNGLATPVSDLNTGLASTGITVNYGGVIANAAMNVTGDIAPPPSGGGSGGGGGGGGSFYNPSSGQESSGNAGTTSSTNSPESNPENNGQESFVLPNISEPSDRPSDNPISNEQNNQSVDSPTQSTDLPRLVFDRPIESVYLPLERPIQPDEVRPVEEVVKPIENTTKEKLGVTRAFVVARVLDKLKLTELKKRMLEKCYADLNNCTNIFRNYSSYAEINLDVNNLRLFPDLGGVPEKDKINQAALLNVVNGYYALENSPFLPDKEISNVEMLKVLTTVLASLEKSKPDYKAEAFDYSSLFYQEIYASYLLAKLKSAQTSMVSPESWLGVVKSAHAISDDAWTLIRNQKTPFVDVRPDLYDNQWYYPIVYNKLCSYQLIDCKEGSRVNPEQVPTADQAEKMIDKFVDYLNRNNLQESANADNDQDGVYNFEENAIYLTNPDLDDTDDDQLKDGEEIATYGTDPNQIDTDKDGLADGLEVNQYGTKPNLIDTDADSFSDGVEVNANTNPLDAGSFPGDVNNNGVADSWEQKYGIEVQNGSQDSDGDGISDLLENKYGTDPTNIDSDRDGFTDGEEILDFFSSPLDENDPGNARDLPVMITNIKYGQLIADASPMIKGVGPASLGDNDVKVQIMLTNEFGGELMLGQSNTDAKGNFVFIPDIAIKNGTYFLIAKALNGSDVKISKPLKITIDSGLDAVKVKPEKIETTPVPVEEELLKNLVLKVDSKDGRPVLYGNISDLGARVNVTWQSLVVSSALIADTTDGAFSVKAPKLEEGRHTVYVQAVREKDNTLGKTIKISFDLSKSAPSKLAGVADQTKEGLAGIMEVVTSKGIWPWLIGVMVLLIVGMGYYVSKGDKKSK